MAWAKVDDGWWSHPKVLGLSLEARGLWVSCLSWSCAQRRDVVPIKFVAMLDPEDGEKCAAELVDAGLWVTVEGGWLIHDWDEYQEKTLSEKRAEAGRKGGLRSGQTRTKPEANPSNGSNQTGSKPDLVPPANGEAGTRPGPARPGPAARAAPTDFASTAETELRALAETKARRKGANNVPALTEKILREDRDLLAAEILENRTAEANNRAVNECLVCDHQGFAWTTSDGQLVGYADTEAHTARVCDHSGGGERRTTNAVRPDTTTGVGSQPASLLPHCANCGDPADIELGDQQACLNCFGLALKGVSR